ncbi:hypothetical protein [Aureispira anguillae]|uniref:Lipoprotein n=1 Tax=Aureispira anguillae TaxID=2864201 RepID=A0A916DXI4_9BACT|nr:hypothetical protein [Aureispira anguillae]BDS15116.1 hypothetical protein AsAng_0059000 [Aureispira anguillae]
MMRNNLFLLIILSFLIACQNEVEQPVHTSKKMAADSLVNAPSHKAIDSMVQAINPTTASPSKTDSINLAYKPSRNSKQLKQLLANPIDLVEFKKHCGANSGGVKRIPSWFRPKKNGFYYRYFVFTDCGCRPHDLEIVVFKFGKDPGRYRDTNEALISVRGDCQAEQLKKLNLAKKKWATIQSIYGNNYLAERNYRIYADGGNILILKLYGKDKIQSFYYVKTNLKKIQSIQDIPKELLK